MLNKLTASTNSPSPFTYTHKHLVDSFYASDTHDRDRIRVTREEKTNEVIECTRKVRLGDLNVYSPKRAADWRVSVNLEIPGSFLSKD
jgi:polynucleotide 5'-triphosphatase